jgi:hypothetical protein
MINTRDNVTITREGSRVIITIETDPAKVQTEMSASGKSLVFASTGGNQPIPGTNLVLGLNCYRKA